MTDNSEYSRRAAIGTLAMTLGAAPSAAMTEARKASNGVSLPEISVLELGAVGDGRADDTTAFENAVALAEETGRRIRIAAGRFKLTRTLQINRAVQICGDGVERSILLMASRRPAPAIHIHAAETDSIIGLGISGLKLICDMGDALCDGIKLSTGMNNSAIHQMCLENIFISKVRIGIDISGVVYRSIFNNITISGSVEKYGIYCDNGNIDVVYNSFWNIEVTNVESGAYAFWVHSNFSNFLNATADGCCYFSLPGGSVRNIAIENITADRPPSEVAIQFNQIQIADGINLIGVDTRKCRYGIQLIGQGMVIRGLRLVSPQPERTILFDDQSEGVLCGVNTGSPTAMLEAYSASETLGRWVIQGAQSITRRQLTYTEGEWSPRFEGWSVKPAVETAAWERIGRRIFLSLVAKGGTAQKGAIIAGLPVTLDNVDNIAIRVDSPTRSTKAEIARAGHALSIAADENFAGSRWEIDMQFRAS